jgi:hypothetical protein
VAIGIAVAVVVLMAALFWWRTGTQQAREEPETGGPPQDAIAMDAYERRDREGRSLGEQLPANRQPGVINHEEK